MRAACPKIRSFCKKEMCGTAAFFAKRLTISGKMKIIKILAYMYYAVVCPLSKTVATSDCFKRSKAIYEYA